MGCYLKDVGVAGLEPKQIQSSKQELLGAPKGYYFELLFLIISLNIKNHYVYKKLLNYFF